MLQGCGVDPVATAVCEWKSIRRYSRIIDADMQIFDADILRKEIGLVAHCTPIARILIN
jgi:hypothetical protein